VESDQGDGYAFNVTQRSWSDKVMSKVDTQDVDFITDSGASEFIDRNQWEKLKRNRIMYISEKTDKKLYTYGAVEPLKLLGKFKTQVNVPNTGRELETDIYVMDDGTGPALLGKRTATELGMLKVGINSVTEDLIYNYG